MDTLTLTGLYIYPVKSIGGMSLQVAKAGRMGLEFDRRWMLVNDEGIFITQRKYADLALLQASIEDHRLIVTHKNDPSLSLSMGLHENTGKIIPVTIWDDKCNGLEVSLKANEWFSAFMQMPVRLVYIPDEEERMVDPRYAKQEELVGFADGYPFLLIGQASLDGLNERLDKPVPMDRFRPNFVFSGGTPHLEDQFDTFLIGDTSFAAVKPCARCVLTTVDQQTAAKNAEPLKTLAGYRAKNNKILFGQNLLHKGNGTIRLGDQLTITRWKPSA
jgi:uncharacterized protein YcbX